MNKSFIVSLGLVVSIGLAGCISSNLFKAPVTDLDVAAHASTMMAKEECYRSNTIEQGDMTALQYSLAKANQSLRDVALAALGKSICDAEDVFTSQIAEVEAKTKMVSSGVSDVAGVAKVGVIGFAASNIIGKIGGTQYTASDNADLVVYDTDTNTLQKDSFNDKDSYNVIAGENQGVTE